MAYRIEIKRPESDAWEQSDQVITRLDAAVQLGRQMVLFCQNFRFRWEILIRDQRDGRIEWEGHPYVPGDYYPDPAEQQQLLEAKANREADEAAKLAFAPPHEWECEPGCPCPTCDNLRTRIRERVDREIAREHAMELRQWVPALGRWSDA